MGKKIIDATPQEVDAARKAMYKEMDSWPDVDEVTPESARAARERIKSAGRSALDEQRRETRGLVPELTERRFKAYKKGGYTIDGIALRGKTRAKLK